MNTNTHSSRAKISTISIKPLSIIAVTLIMVTIVIIWWLHYSSVGNIDAINTIVKATEEESIKQDNNIPVNISSLLNKSEDESPDSGNKILFEELWIKLHDLKLRNTLTARQLLDTPGFNLLSAIQKQHLVAEVIALLNRNELDSNVFLEDLSGQTGFQSISLNEAANKSDPEHPKTQQINETTVEQALIIENVKERLHNPATARTLTASELLKSPEIQSLPTHLRQELANEVMGMLSRGEIDSATFLAAAPEVSQLNVMAEEEASRAAVTHEQWQYFEELQTRLHATNFQANTMLSQLLTSQEYKSLPVYLRKQLSTEAVAVLEKKN